MQIVMIGERGQLITDRAKSAELGFQIDLHWVRVCQILWLDVSF